MTREQLELAQFFHQSFTKADKLLSGRLHAVTTFEGRKSVFGAETIRIAARDAFYILTGAAPSDVSIFDLNADHPAEWARKRKVTL